MIYSIIILLVNVGLAYLYLKKLNWSGLKKGLLLLPIFGLLNITLVTSTLWGLHHKSANEFKETPQNINYAWSKELNVQIPADVKREASYIKEINSLLVGFKFNSFTGFIEENLSREFLVENALKNIQSKRVLAIQKSLLGDPLGDFNGFFGCLENVKQPRSIKRFCKDVNFEKYLAVHAISLIEGTLNQKSKVDINKNVDRLKKFFNNYDTISGTLIGSSYLGEILEMKMRFFNLIMVLNTHIRVDAKEKRSLAKLKKVLVKKQEFKKIASWYYLQSSFDRSNLATREELAKQVGVKFGLGIKEFKWNGFKKIKESITYKYSAWWDHICGIPLSTYLSKYLDFTGTLGYWNNKQELEKTRPKWAEDLLPLIRRQGGLVQSDYVLTIRKIFRFKEINRSDIQYNHFLKLKSFFNLEGKIQYLEYMRGEGFSSIKKVWMMQDYLY